MMQRATPEAVRGTFTNVTLTLRGETYRLFQRGDALWAEMPDPDWTYGRAAPEEVSRRGSSATMENLSPPRTEKRISMTTGSHHMQAYWVSSKYDNQQFSFPFRFCLKRSDGFRERTFF